jgi:hypothetical protein
MMNPMKRRFRKCCARSQAGKLVPKIRIGRCWINVLWVFPFGFVLAVIGVAAAQELRELPRQHQRRTDGKTVEYLSCLGIVERVNEKERVRMTS